jgi:hypothetical protein
MKLSFLVSTCVAGGMLWHNVPPFVIRLTDRRNIIPFGRDSSPSINALGSSLNFVGGCLLVCLPCVPEAAAKANPDTWLLALEALGAENLPLDVYDGDTEAKRRQSGIANAPGTRWRNWPRGPWRGPWT